MEDKDQYDANLTKEEIESDKIDHINKMSSKWVREATIAFGNLFKSELPTELDKALLGDQYSNLIQDKTIVFEDSSDTDFKRIRSNRLKLLGYSWKSDIKSWIKEDA
jgi:hypothetical protein